MTGLELVFCTSAAVFNSISQLLIKAASVHRDFQRTIELLGLGATMLLCSVFFIVIALQTLSLSKLVLFVVLPYILVPIGSCYIFGEYLQLRLWFGVILIILGVLCVNV